MLILENVYKKYKGKTTIDNISLKIKGVFGLIGPNGAGKTTLLRIISTATRMNSGNIQFNEINWEQLEEVRKRIGYLPQHFDSYKNLTVEETLTYFAYLKGVKDITYEVKQVLKYVNLENERDKKMKHLSGGMLRRVGIGQTLLNNPEIIIIDEPTAGIDIEERIRFNKIIKKLGEEKIVIISSHLIDDLDNICDEFAIMNEGKIIYHGSKKDLIIDSQIRVWKIDASKGSLSNYLNNEKVVSFLEKEKCYEIRMLQPQPPPGGVEVSPTLEEIYIHHINSQTSMENL
ncbi:ATP-binding cassette domain-containing protein [Priestia megaterium]|uniref:ATP-binding cassette domain-containing protein n=1 Tax=Priestia megaterium TaxID=1404 RepID=UPI0012B6DA40|nr:ATP-binding cassette domain-containing protein [Priestia megaterium]